MAKKPLGTDSMGIQKTMRIGDYLADCGGQFALNAMTGLVSAVLYFYTEKVGVAAATAANVLLAAKIVDAFTDLIMGKIMDNGKSPKGKCRRGSCAWPFPRSLRLWHYSPCPQA